jgi:hypothetical protein
MSAVSQSFSWIRWLPKSPKSPSTKSEESKRQDVTLEDDAFCAPRGPGSVRGSPVCGPPSYPFPKSPSMAVGGGGQLEGAWNDAEVLGAGCGKHKGQSPLPRAGSRDSTGSIEAAFRTSATCLPSCLTSPSEDALARNLRKQIAAQDSTSSAFGPRR